MPVVQLATFLVQNGTDVRIYRINADNTFSQVIQYTATSGRNVYNYLLYDKEYLLTTEDDGSSTDYLMKRTLDSSNNITATTQIGTASQWTGGLSKYTTGKSIVANRTNVYELNHSNNTLTSILSATGTSAIRGQSLYLSSVLYRNGTIVAPTVSWGSGIAYWWKCVGDSQFRSASAKTYIAGVNQLGDAYFTVYNVANINCYRASAPTTLVSITRNSGYNSNMGMKFHISQNKWIVYKQWDLTVPASLYMSLYTNDTFVQNLQFPSAIEYGFSDILDDFSKFYYYRIDTGKIMVYNDIFTNGTSSNSTLDLPVSGYTFKSLKVTDFDIGGTVANPTSSITPGAVEIGTNVTLSCSTSGATIYYTTNGDTPDETSTEYTSPIEITSAVTLKARAYKIGYTPSEVVSFSYTILKCEDPQAIPIPGQVLSGTEVELYTGTSGAIIRYTTNGTDPTELSSIYTDPIVINSTKTIKAKAYKTNWEASDIVSLLYEVEVIPIRWTSNVDIETDNINKVVGTQSIRLFIENRK